MCRANGWQLLSIGRQVFHNVEFFAVEGSADVDGRFPRKVDLVGGSDSGQQWDWDSRKMVD